LLIAKRQAGANAKVIEGEAEVVGRPVLFEVGSEREQEILVERSTCSLQ
jgi:hypothetical protein